MMTQCGRRRRQCLLLAVSGVVSAAAVGEANAQAIRTPAAAATPRVNGPTVFGVRPGSVFSYKIPATGNGTLAYSAIGLPTGLSVNSSTGMITGAVAAAGNYPVTLTASNSLGTATRNFTIKVGNTIGLTPAMGWSSWNAWQE